MHYTIVNNLTNEIRSVTYYPKAFGDFTQLVSEDETAIEGNYSPKHFRYTGTDFEPIPDEEKPVETYATRDTHSVLVALIKDLKNSGYALSLHREFVNTKDEAKDLIDQAASRACERFVSQGKFTVFEYQLTQQEVEEWRSAGSPTNDVPEMLQSWLDNSNFATAEEAAANIEQTALQFKSVIQATRRLRLQGKKAIDEAVDYKSVMDLFISQLDSV